MQEQTGKKQSLFSAAGAVAATASTEVASTSVMPPLPPGEEIYDIVPQMAMSWPWLWVLYNFLLVAAAMIIIWRFYVWLTTPVEKIREPVVQSPQKIAMRAVKRLKLSPIWSARQMKEICESLTTILKEYIFAAYKIGIGSAATSDEMLGFLQQQKVPGHIYTKTRELLYRCDQIKYTGADSGSYDPDSLLQELIGLIEERGWNR